VIVFVTLGDRQTS